MRPLILAPLFRSLASLSGVGPRLERTFARLFAETDGAEPRVKDLLFHLPVGIIDRRQQPGVAKAPEGAVVTLKLRIDRHRASPPGSRAPYKVFGQDDTGEIALVYFRGDRKWLEKLLPVGETLWVSGRVEWFNGAPQIAHPDHVVREDAFEQLPHLEPVYGLTEGLGAKTVAKAVASALALLPELQEWQSAPRRSLNGWPSFADALRRLHHPQRPQDVEPGTAERTRIAFDELLADQLALGLVRASLKRSAAIARAGSGALRERILAALPFRLTGSQEQAAAEIARELARGERMVRLLQGDVGSGKTVVAVLAMAQVAEAGGQSALMAPTELLARQHFHTIAPLAAAAGLEARLLTGRERGRERETVLAGLADGTIAIVVGTHALIQETVTFRDLGLAIVDEQHRFGVEQRVALANKGRGAHLLVTTATPIPRTLLLTLFGDMDVSRLTEKPAGRKPIDTRIVSLERLDEVVERIGAAVDHGQKAYWVCPLVAESEAVDLAAAEERHAALAGALGPVVGLLHGRMGTEEKVAAMERFRLGETRVLVSTTVVEVGVDVPDATIMVVEHAEQFGLAQLHQLRGRVGRGSTPSVCLLLYRPPLGEAARARLSILRETEDGFRIAEEDLRLRGGGEMLGTRQSGLPEYRLARLDVHGDLLEAARDEARAILADDPGLEGPRGEALRVLLYLFERDAAVKLLRAG